MNSNQKSINELANKLAVKMPTYETILVVAAIVGLALKIIGINSGAMFLIISSLSLAALNMLMAYSSPKEGSLPFDSFIQKSQSIGTSVTIIGVLFLLLNWNGAPNMIMVGILTLVVTIGYHLFKKHSFDTILKPIILLIIALALFLTPKETLQNLHITSSNLITK